MKKLIFASIVLILLIGIVVGEEEAQVTLGKQAETGTAPTDVKKAPAKPTDPNLAYAQTVVQAQYGSTVAVTPPKADGTDKTYSFTVNGYQGTVLVKSEGDNPTGAEISSKLPSDTSTYPIPKGTTAKGVVYEYDEKGQPTGKSKWTYTDAKGIVYESYVGSTTSGKMVDTSGQTPTTDTDKKTDDKKSTKKVDDEPVFQHQMCSETDCSNARLDIRDNSVWVLDGDDWEKCPETGGSSECAAARDYRAANMEPPYNKPRDLVKLTWTNYWDAFMSAGGYSGISNFFFSDEDEEDQLLAKDSELYQLLGGSEYMINEICLSGIDDTGDTTNVAFSPDTGGQAHAFINAEKQEYINYSALADENYTGSSAPTINIYKISYEVSAGREGVDDCDITFNVRVKGANGDPYINENDLVVSSKSEPDNDANTSTISKVGSSMIVHHSQHDYSQVCIYYKDITQLCIDGIDDGEEQCSPIIESGTASAITADDLDSTYAGMFGLFT
ncbi:hypothetical protein K9M79_05550 [Candidatus Woesearchaeota archaeon]|nr:hypothetical protein [Candidatus Woesearchaeota archaeon]